MPKTCSIACTTSEMVLILSLLVGNPLPKSHIKIFFIEPSLKSHSLRNTPRWISIHRKGFLGGRGRGRGRERESSLRNNTGLDTVAIKALASPTGGSGVRTALQICPKLRQGNKVLHQLVTRHGLLSKRRYNIGWDGSLQMRPNPGE